MVDESAVGENESEASPKSVVRLCDQCRKEPFKYKCPRCLFRSCSLQCSKHHKEQHNCSGQRDPNTFGTIKRLNDYTPSVAVNDQKFLDKVKDDAVSLVTSDTFYPTENPSQVNNSPSKNAANSNQPVHSPNSKSPQVSLENISASHQSNSPFVLDKQPSVQPSSQIDAASDSDYNNQSTNQKAQSESSASHHKQCSSTTACYNEEQSTRSVSMSSMNECEERISNDHPLTRKQHYLCSNANRRRIWLTISRDKEEGASRHEQFSDTIFWTIRLIFRREVKASEGGDEKERNTVDYIYTANNIPESIAVATLLKQFLKPKKIGPVVNRDELDADKMLPFQEAGIDNLLVYMPVPMEDKQRFYVVDPTKKILDNLRNRFVLDHPTMIVTLNNECNDYVQLSEQESQELRELQRQQRRRREAQQDHRGRFNYNQRGNGFARGGGGGGGGYHSRGGFGNAARGGDSRGRGQRGNNAWKRGRFGGNDQGGAPRGGPPWKRGRYNARGGGHVYDDRDYAANANIFDPFELSEGEASLKRPEAWLLSKSASERYSSPPPSHRSAGEQLKEGNQRGEEKTSNDENQHPRKIIDEIVHKLVSDVGIGNQLDSIE